MMKKEIVTEEYKKTPNFEDAGRVSKQEKGINRKLSLRERPELRQGEKKGRTKKNRGMVRFLIDR